MKTHTYMRVGVLGIIALGAALWLSAACAGIEPLPNGDGLAAPTWVSVTPGNTAIELIWSGVGDTYVLDRDLSEVYDGAPPTHIDTGLNNGTRYCYRVKAVAGDLESDYSIVRCATPMAVPVGSAVNRSLEATINLGDEVPRAASYDLYLDSSFTGDFPAFSLSKGVDKSAVAPGDRLIAEDVEATTYELERLSNDCVTYPIKIVPKDSDGNLASVSTIVNADPDTEGTLDTTFGTGGVIENPSPITSRFSDLAIDADGKILAAFDPTGFVISPSTALIAYEEDGTVVWGVSLGALAGMDRIHVVTIDSEGRILVGGQLRTGHSMQICRIIDNGTSAALDASFGNSAGCLIGFAQSNSAIHDIALDSAGRILVAGFRDNAGAPPVELNVWRLDADGNPDVSFGTAGEYVYVTADNTYGYGIAIDPSGHIYVAGRAELAFTADAIVVELDSSGSYVATYTDPTAGFATDVEALSTGEALAAGYIDAGSDFAFSWFMSAFGSPTVYASYGNTVVNGLAIDCHDRAVLSGELEGRPMVMRSDDVIGGIDVNFASSGWFRLSAIPGVLQDAEIDAVGRIVIVGQEDTGTSHPRIWRLY